MPGGSYLGAEYPAGDPFVAGGASTLSPTGIATAEALGNASVTVGSVTITPTAIPSAEALGNATVTVGLVAISPTGIPTAALLGDATVTAGPVTLSPTGIPTAEALGDASVSTLISTTGIPSAEALGNASITGEQQAHIYTKFALSALTGAVDLSSETIRAIALSGYAVGTTIDTAQFVADVLAAATETIGGTYPAGGVALTGVTLTESGHSYVLSCDPIVFSGSDIPVAFVLFADTASGSDATNRVILYWDIGSTQMLGAITPDPTGTLIATAT